MLIQFNLAIYIYIYIEGNLRRAEDYFKNINEAVEQKKKEKYRFCAHVGLVCSIYINEALTY
jgi:hypothetical protein